MCNDSKRTPIEDCDVVTNGAYVLQYQQRLPPAEVLAERAEVLPSAEPAEVLPSAEPGTAHTLETAAETPFKSQKRKRKDRELDGLRSSISFPSEVQKRRRMQGRAHISSLDSHRKLRVSAELGSAQPSGVEVAEETTIVEVAEETTIVEVVEVPPIDAAPETKLCSSGMGKAAESKPLSKWGKEAASLAESRQGTTGDYWKHDGSATKVST